jgi:sugar phosphate isomerase/epimerase
MGAIPPENLFFSTSGLSQQIGYEETIKTYQELGIEQIELGYCPDDNVSPSEAVTSADWRAICHNYFLPDEPYFINLASDDEQIREWSVSYTKRAIDFCANHGIELYTFHGGFRVDPNQELEFNGEPTPYKQAFDTFVDETAKIAEYADERGVTLGIENNVIEETHLRDGENRILMFCRAAEFEQLFEAVDNIGLLLDAGHLRVAANTLTFDPAEFGTLSDSVVALHVHENDGQTDEHLPVEPDGWCVEFYREHLGKPSVPVVVESHFDDVEELAETRRQLVE